MKNTINTLECVLRILADEISSRGTIRCTSLKVRDLFADTLSAQAAKSFKVTASLNFGTRTEPLIFDAELKVEQRGVPVHDVHYLRDADTGNNLELVRTNELLLMVAAERLKDITANYYVDFRPVYTRVDEGLIFEISCNGTYVCTVNMTWSSTAELLAQWHMQRNRKGEDYDVRAGVVNILGIDVDIEDVPHDMRKALGFDVDDNGEPKARLKKSPRSKKTS